MRNPIPARPPAVRRAAVPALLLAALLGLAAGPGCSSGSSPAFDLTAPRGARSGGFVGGLLVVVEPTALEPLSNERIMARDAAGSISYIGGAQWADRLPRLFQTRLIQTFENSSRLKAVGRPGDGLTADYQLDSDLRAFQYDAATGEAVVEVSIKILATRTGKIVGARIFRSRMPVPSADGAIVAQALDRTLATVLVDIVRWAGTRG